MKGRAMFCKLGTALHLPAGVFFAKMRGRAQFQRLRQPETP